MELFRNAAEQNHEYSRLCSYIDKHEPLPALMTGLSHIHKAHFISSLLSKEELLPVLVVAESEGIAQKLCLDINAMCGSEKAMLYPAKEMVLGNYEAASREYEHKRIFVLNAMLSGRCAAVICSPEAAGQLTIPPEELEARNITLNEGDDISQEQLITKLMSAGYYRCDMIEGAGQFSVRGGIIDVFPPSSSAPFRIELWGDTIDSISQFDLESQRRTEPLEAVCISPASETLFDSNEELCEKIEAIAKKLRGKHAEGAREKLNDDVSKMRGGVQLHSFDKYFPLCYRSEATIFDYANAVFVCESVPVREGYRGVTLQHTEDLKILTEDHHICKGLDRFILTRAEFQSELEARAAVYFDTFLRGGDLKLGVIIDSQGAIQTSPWSGEYKVLEDELRVYLSKGYSCVVFAGTEKSAATLAGDLTDDGFDAILSTSPTEPLPKKVIVTHGTLTAGIEYMNDKLAVFTHTAVHAARKRVPKKKKGEEIRSLADISIGDLVVHYSHGIGVFEGVHKIESQGVAKDYIRIRYAGKDVLHVPVTQLDLVSRYIGTGDASTVKLNKLNSEQWQRSKAKAKAAAKEMAAELIELYSKRMRSQGFEFPEDDSMQEDFEAHFSYIETDSQLRCIDEIKADMQKPHPMERLLCGDVGFGKTEVALRAAFKCIEAGKQCAILVPTTVLAWQHFQTAIKRMEAFPVNIALLSRHKSPSEQREILRGLKSGRVDLIIGTHRIIQDDIQFKD
ncbi:MAG: DEAD/DEAH box helicase, partial [Oscillospiraceae bacterium]|nr:DEAD/DEAH box helicase [Oscillospiraceae bacterium]